MTNHQSTQQPDPFLFLSIESLDLDAQGIAHHDGKVIFIQGALPNEQVKVEILKRKKKFEKANTVEVIKPWASRVQPRCPSFGVCGGCVMQHVDFSAQVAIKSRVVEDHLWHLGRIKAENVLRPLQGSAWGYRHRARLTCRWVTKKGGMLVGFHEKSSSFVVEMTECHVLPKKISALLKPLRVLLGQLSIAQRVPQIEVAVGQEHTALVLRHLEEFSDEDKQKLMNFANLYQIVWWLQPAGPTSVYQFYPTETPLLSYSLPEFNITMPFLPTDFTQVNHAVNQAMVSQAIRLLGITPSDRVADLFCGLGNFSLPLATLAKSVVGVEGSESLIRRAQENAKLNGVNQKTEFFAQNLFDLTVDQWESWGVFDCILIDPPREGAQALVQALAKASYQPRRVVYVSCNSATLARDAAILIHQGPYKLKFVGAINMFPHTAHIESMAVFEPRT